MYTQRQSDTETEKVGVEREGDRVRREDMRFGAK